jgi:hypothetical protein
LRRFRTRAYRDPVRTPASPTFSDFPPSPAAGSGRRDPAFALLQATFWPLYAMALMLPWIGTYTLASMLPNKLLVALTGAMAAAGLRFVYRRARRGGLSSARLLGVALVGSTLAGVAWDGVLYALLGHWAHFDVARFGTLGSGIPQLAGGLYHALVLASWSLAYLVLEGGSAGMNDASVPAATPTPEQRPAPAGVDPAAPPLRPGTRVVLQDGKHSLVFEADEIDWVEADGDYLHVHAGERRLFLRATISRTERILPADAYVRIHRSTLVRIAQVRELISKPNRECEVILRNGTRLRASRSYAGQLRAALEISAGANADA